MVHFTSNDNCKPIGWGHMVCPTDITEMASNHQIAGRPFIKVFSTPQREYITHSILYAFCHEPIYLFHFSGAFRLRPWLKMLLEINTIVFQMVCRSVCVLQCSCQTRQASLFLLWSVTKWPVWKECMLFQRTYLPSNVYLTHLICHYKTKTDFFPLWGCSLPMAYPARKG